MTFQKAVQSALSWQLMLPFMLRSGFALLYPTGCCRLEGNSGHIRLTYETAKRASKCFVGTNMQALINKTSKQKVENSVSVLYFVFQKIKPKQYVKGLALVEVHL